MRLDERKISSIELDRKEERAEEGKRNIRLHLLYFSDEKSRSSGYDYVCQIGDSLIRLSLRWPE
jgi:hypothetical protein